MRLPALLCALFLAVAAPSAAAQSAGDDQYSDPFGGGGQEPTRTTPAEPAPAPEPTPAEPDAPVSSAPVDPGTTDVAPDATTSGTEADPTVTTAVAPDGAAAPGELPRTGDDAYLQAMGGVLLLLTGAALRRRVRRPAGG